MTFESGERLLRQERLHPAVFVWPVLAIVGLALLSSPLFLLLAHFRQTFGTNLVLFPLWVLFPDILIGLSVLLVTLIAYLKSEVTLTNKRVIYRTGFLVRAAGALPLENVEGIQILESLPGRLFRYGTVTLTTLGGARYSFPCIANPELLQTLLQKAACAAKAATRLASRPAPVPQDASRYMPKVAPTSSGLPPHFQNSTASPPPPAWNAPQELDFVEPQLSSSGNRSLFAAVGVSLSVVLLAGIVLLAVFARSASPSRASTSSGPMPLVVPTAFSSPQLSPIFPVLPLQSGGRPLAEIKAAAERGDPLAQDKLGDVCRSDPEKAIVWYRKAAAQGIANSQYQLAHLLMAWANNPMTSKEASALHFDEALPWLIKAANRGVGYAQAELGVVYRDGKWVARDLPEAYKWFSLAATGPALDTAVIMGKMHRDALVLNLPHDQIAEGNRRLAAFAPNSAPSTPLPEPSYVQKIKLSGVSGVPPRRYAMINGKTMAAGESAILKLDGRAVALHCVAITDTSATITIDGVTGPRQLRLP